MFTSDVGFPFLYPDCFTFTDLNCYYGRLGLCERRVGLDEENFRVRSRQLFDNGGRRRRHYGVVLMSSADNAY